MAIISHSQHIAMSAAKMVSFSRCEEAIIPSLSNYLAEKLFSEREDGLELCCYESLSNAEECLFGPFISNISNERDVGFTEKSWRGWRDDRSW